MCLSHWSLSIHSDVACHAYLLLRFIYPSYMYKGCARARQCFDVQDHIHICTGSQLHNNNLAFAAAGTMSGLMLSVWEVQLICCYMKLWQKIEVL